jgi:cbb3-type cytochrome oxidase subunit 3
MGFKDVLNSMSAHLTEVALVIFFLAFMAIVVWTVTRSRKEVDRWANLPNDNSKPGPKEKELP